MIVRSLHPDFDHIRDQLLTSHKVPSMDTLTTCLLPTLMPQPHEAHALVEPFVVVSHEEEEGATLEEVDVEVEGILNAHIVNGWITPKKTATPCMIFPLKQLMSLRLKLLTQLSLRMNINCIYA